MPATTKDTIENDPDISVSIVSLWEIAIKMNIGKLTISFSIDELFEEIYNLHITVLPITQDDLKNYKNLPLVHRDPFDRMIISQAISTNQSVISKDGQFDGYSIARVWDRYN
ncbi:MAG: type II toxin-antitoxin system VapC family toxin [Bacteroidota bacterium]